MTEDPTAGSTADPIVGIVLISHSASLASGLADMAQQIGGETVPLGVAGGTDDGRIGTSMAKLVAAVGQVRRGAGVVLIPDIGSSVLTVRAYLADLGELAEPIVVADAPFVEGTIAAVVTASSGADVKDVLAAAESARGFRKL